MFGPLIDVAAVAEPTITGWLSGILQHNTNRVAPPSHLAYFVGYNPNPNAAVTARDDLDRAH